MSRSYDELFDRQKPLLWVMFDTSMDANETLRWLILDAHNGDQLYARVPTLDLAISFMRTAERQGDATVDQVSVHFCQQWQANAYSLKVPSLEGEPAMGGQNHLAAPASLSDVSSTAKGLSESTSPSSNVLPFKRRLVV